MSTFVLPPERAEAIISHMNEDHQDAIVLYAQHFAGIKDARVAEMLNLDATSMFIRVTKADGSVSDVKVELMRPLESAGDARVVLVDMVTEARKHV